MFADDDVSDAPALRERVRRAYELGRVRDGALLAAAVTGVVALVSWRFGAGPFRAVLPLTFLAWVALAWRGGVALRGAYTGLLAGVVTFLLPLSLLRPCCRPGVRMALDGSCCTSPGACVAAGAVLGLLLAMALPRGGTKGGGARRLEATVGMVAGVTSVAVHKCAALFLGEALGLLGGLVGGVLLLGGAQLLLERRAARA